MISHLIKIKVKISKIATGRLFLHAQVLGNLPVTKTRRDELAPTSCFRTG